MNAKAREARGLGRAVKGEGEGSDKPEQKLAADAEGEQKGAGDAVEKGVDAAETKEGDRTPSQVKPEVLA